MTHFWLRRFRTRNERYCFWSCATSRDRNPDVFVSVGFDPGWVARVRSRSQRLWYRWGLGGFDPWWVSIPQSPRVSIPPSATGFDPMRFRTRMVPMGAGVSIPDGCRSHRVRGFDPGCPPLHGFLDTTHRSSVGRAGDCKCFTADIPRSMVRIRPVRCGWMAERSKALV